MPHQSHDCWSVYLWIKLMKDVCPRILFQYAWIHFCIRWWLPLISVPSWIGWIFLPSWSRTWWKAELASAQHSCKFFLLPKSDGKIIILKSSKRISFLRYSDVDLILCTSLTQPFLRCQSVQSISNEHSVTVYSFT